MVFSDLEQVDVDLLIGGLFPAHKGNPESSLVLVNQPQLESVEHLSVEHHAVLPNEERLVQVVAVSQVALSEHMQLGVSRTVFDQALLPVLQFLLLRDLLVQSVFRALELPGNVAEPDGVEHLLHQPFSPNALNFLDEQLLLLKIPFVPGCFAPVLPSVELHTRIFSPLLLTGMLESQEDPLLEPGFGDNVRNAFVAFEQRISFGEREPEDISTSQLSFPPALDNSVEEVVLCLSALNKVTPSAQVVALVVFCSA